jgi:uncharacterized protein (DUF433 family)
LARADSRFNREQNHERVQGTRISVAFLLECLASGMSVAEIVDAYPTLNENAVQGALRELAHEKEAAAA